MIFKLALIWLLTVAVVIMAAVRFAPAQTPSKAIMSACDSDARRLCPKEYRQRVGRIAAIGNCMKERAGPSTISLRCQAAWIKEHGLSR